MLDRGGIFDFSSNSRRASGAQILRRRPIFFLRPAHHDLERIIRQRPLQRFRIIPWRSPRSSRSHRPDADPVRLSLAAVAAVRQAVASDAAEGH
jgi:hypothetical protein